MSRAEFVRAFSNCKFVGMSNSCRWHELARKTFKTGILVGMSLDFLQLLGTRTLDPTAPTYPARSYFVTPS